MSADATDGTLDWLAGVLRRASGFELGPQKTYLIEARLAPLARARGFGSVGALLAALRRTGDRELEATVVEAMAIGETSFFRDGTPFDLLSRRYLPVMAAARPPGRPIRVWCAAVSTGQEAWSLAIACRESSVRLAGRRVEILATDLSQAALEQAQRGVYATREVRRGLPPALLRRHFRESAEGWSVDEAVRRMVTFRRHNLLDPDTPDGPFDAVLCRNVLIYFAAETKAAVLDRIAARMVPGGVLFLGAAETAVGVCGRFRPDPAARGAFLRGVG